MMFPNARRSDRSDAGSKNSFGERSGGTST